MHPLELSSSKSDQEGDLFPGRQDAHFTAHRLLGKSHKYGWHCSELQRTLQLFFPFEGNQYYCPPYQSGGGTIPIPTEDNLPTASDFHLAKTGGKKKKSSKKRYGSLKLELAAHSYKHQTEQLQPCSHNHPLVRKGITSPRLPGAKPAQHLARNLGGETCQ